MKKRPRGEVKHCFARANKIDKKLIFRVNDPAMALDVTEFAWLFDVLAGYAVQASNSDLVFGIDMSIEGLKSQRYSVGIFGFLVVSLVFFSVIIYFYLPRRDSSQPLKTGEKIMFGAIMFGVVIAVVVGWLQLIDGYLF